MARDIDAEDEDTPAPESDGREKLRKVAHYAMLAFAPVVSIVALGVALFATGNHSGRALPGEFNTRADSLNTISSPSREELENLKFGMTREKSQRVEERKKAEERDEIIIRNVTRLQEKLKITPTLEEQLRAAAKAHAAVPAAAAEPAPAAVTAPAADDKKHAVSAPASAPVPAGAVNKPAPAVHAPKAEEKKQAASTNANQKDEKKKTAPVPKPEEKMSPKVKALKNAIEQYNKQ